jgi:hypothetical protein
MRPYPEKNSLKKGGGRRSVGVAQQKKYFKVIEIRSNKITPK